MKHIIFYQFLNTLRDRVSLFWPAIFPMVLGTLFSITFGNAANIELETIPVALVEQEENIAFSTFIDTMQEEEDNPVISVTRMEEDAALEALDTGEVTGVYYIAETPSLTIRKNNIEASVLDGILSTYLRYETILTDLAENAMTDRYSEHLSSGQGMADVPVVSQIQQEVEEYIEEVMTDIEETSYITEVTLSRERLSANMNCFFGLIGMACMFGCFMGMRAAMELQANTSALGARCCISPARKSIQILAVFVVNVTVAYLCNILLLLYLKFILGIGFGDHWGGMLLTCAFGNIIGVCMGIAIGSIGKLPMAAKVGLNVGITLSLSFLAGLMVSEMKNIIDINCPIINRLNPVAVISDAFYCLCVYNDPVRYQNDLLLMALYSAGLLLVSYCAIRRERYDSI